MPGRESYANARGCRTMRAVEGVGVGGGFVRAVITGWDVSPPPLLSPFWGEMRLSSQSLPAPKSDWGPALRAGGLTGGGGGERQRG